MAETSYPYTISTDVKGGAVQPHLLRRDVNRDSTVSINCKSISIDSDNLTIIMNDALDATQKSALDSVVSDHDATKKILGRSDKHVTSSEVQSTSTGYKTKTSMEVDVIGTGEYILFWAAEIKCRRHNGISVKIHDGTTDLCHVRESTWNQWKLFSGWVQVTLTDETRTFYFDYKAVYKRWAAHVKNARFFLQRIDEE